MDKYTIEEQQYRNGYNAGYVDAIREMMRFKNDDIIKKDLDADFVEAVAGEKNE